MAKLHFGKQEEIVCIADVNIKVGGARATCLAYKTTTHYVGAGLYVKDDGYVLGSGTGYVPLDAASIKAHQATGALPSPLPAYSLPAATYAVGYSLWILLVVAVVFAVVRVAFGGRKSEDNEKVGATSA